MRPSAMFVVLAALLAAPALADTPQPYTSSALGFSATFPYEVHEKLEEDGSGTAACVDPAGIMYMVGVVAGTPDSAKMSVKEQLDSGIAGAVAKVKGTLVSQKDITLGKIPGREAEISLTGAQATFRFYIVGKKAYMIGVVHKDGTTPPMTPAAFFASLKIKPAKKK